MYEHTVETLKDMIKYNYGFADNEKPKCITALEGAISVLEELDENNISMPFSEWREVHYHHSYNQGFVDGIKLYEKAHKN